MPSTATPTSKAANGAGVPTLDIKRSHAAAAHRPSAPRGFLDRVGRAMRYVMGVDEALMDRVHHERAVYAAFGALVVMTGVVASFSMWFAVEEMAGTGPLAAILPGVIWLLFIYNLDRLIVTSRPGGAWHRWLMFVSRTLVAVLLGLVIAEPLVLKVFESQIEEQVRTDRATHLRTLQTTLLNCNPDPSDANAPAVTGECLTQYRLAVSTNPAAQSSQLVSLRQHAGDLTALITKERAEIASLNDIAAKECNGTRGSGLSGRFGEGINCRTRRGNAEEYESSVPLAAQQAQLADLTGRITALEEGIRVSRDTFATQRDAEIRDWLAKETPVDAKIGLLERMAALGTIGGDNPVLGLGIWLVRLLFICIDCSPVLLKLSHRSRYDAMVDTALDDAVETQRISLQSRDSERAMAQDEQDQRRREHAIAMDQRIADAVDARAAEYERQARNEPVPSDLTGTSV